MFYRNMLSNKIATVDRKRILIFLGITYGISIAGSLMIFIGDGIKKSEFSPTSSMANIGIYAAAYAPALAVIVTRLITREGWANTYLRPNLHRGWPFYLAAICLPVLAILLGGAIYYLLFPGMFDSAMSFARQAGEISATDTVSSVLSKEVRDSSSVILVGSVLVFIGEEFGWRAYLLPKLMALGAHKAFLISGAMWGVFHWPEIFLGFHYGTEYWGAPIVGALLFVWIITWPGVIFSWVTLRTGSVWPACIAHAVNNSFFSVMVFFLSGESNVLIGPSPAGIVGCLG